MFYNKNATSDLDPLFAKHAKAQGLRYDFLRNIGLIESSYGKRVTNKLSSAKGVMQIVKGTGAELGLHTDADFFDPDKNIGGGAVYLAKMLKASHGDEVRAALAYHSGLGSSDIKNYDAGNYDAITPAGRDYIQKVKGNAVGGEHAQSHFGDVPEAHVPLNVSSTPKPNPKLERITNADLPLASQAFTADTQVGAAIPDPHAESDYETLYRDENNGMSPEQVDNLSTFHGTGEAVHTELHNSTIGTIGNAWQQGGAKLAWQVARPSFLNGGMTDEQIKQLDDSGVDPKYWNVVKSADVKDTASAIAVAKSNQQADEQLQKDHVGVGANLVGGTVGMIGDPVTYLSFIQPELGAEALAEKMGGGAVTRFATKSGLKMTEGAGYGVASSYVRNHIAGGDQDIAQAAIGGAILGGTIHGMTAAGRSLLPRVASRFRPEAEVVPETGTGTTAQAPEAIENSEVSQSNVVEQHDLHAHSRRLELQESARTYEQADPTIKEFTGEERVHEHEGQRFTVDGDDAPTEVAHPLDFGPAPDATTINGQRMDGANPFNPATRRAAQHIAQTYGEQDLHTVGSQHNFRAAQGMNFGKSFSDIGYAMNTAADDQLRAFNGMLMESPTGVVDLNGQKAPWQASAGKAGNNAWYGNRVGKFTGSEILNELEALDNKYYSDIGEATKKLHQTARYIGMDEATARQEMWRRITMAIEDTTGDKMSQLSNGEREAANIVRGHYKDKAYYLQNTGHWGMTDAPAILNSRINPENYTSIVYDRPLINDFVSTYCGGDKNLAAYHIRSSFMRSYHTQPEVKARVNEALNDAHLAQPEVAKRQKVVDEETTKLQKATDKVQEATNDFQDLGSKGEHTQGFVDKAMQDNGFNSHVDYDDAFNAKVVSRFEKRMSKYKKAVAQEKQDAIFTEEREAVIKERNALVKKAKSKANVEWQNARRRVTLFETARRAQEAKVADATAKVKADLTPEELEAGADELAANTAYGIINAGEGADAQDLAAIQRMVDAGDLIGIGNSGFRKTRSLFGYDSEVTLPDGNRFSVNNLRDFNLDNTMPTYNRQMNGQIAITGSTGMLPEDAIAHLNEIEKRLSVPKGFKPKGEERAAYARHAKDLETTKEGLKVLLRRGRANHKQGAMNTIGSILTDLAYVTHNQFFWLNNFGECAGLVNKAMTQMVHDAFPAIGRLSGDLSKMSREDLNQFHHDLLGHEIHSHLRSTREDYVNRLVDGNTNPLLAQMLGSVKGGTAWMAEASPFTKLLTGTTKLITEAQEKEAIQSIAKAAMNDTKSLYLDNRFLNSAGLTPEQGESIIQMFKDHAEIDADGRITIKDIDSLRHDHRSALLTRVARRASSEAIQKESIAQASSRAMGGWGQLALQFKRFVMKSMNSKFFRSLHEFNGNSRKADIALMTLGGAGLSTMVYGLQAIAQAMSMPEDKRREYLKYKFDPKMIAYQMISRNSIIGAPVGLGGNIASLFGFDPGLSIRSSILQPEGAPEKSRGNPLKTSTGIQGYLGGNLMKQLPGFQMGAGGIALGYNAYDYLTAKDQITANHAAKQSYQALRQVMPIDPVTQALIRHFYEVNGVNTEAK